MGAGVLGAAILSSLMGCFLAIIGALIGALLAPAIFLGTHPAYNNDGLGVAYALVYYVPFGALGGAILGGIIGKAISQKNLEKDKEK